VKRIILFRYHNNFDRNKELLKFYKYLNPGIDIYGLYGGPEELFTESSQVLGEVLNHNYLLRHENPEWNWKNSDMSFQQWYNHVGHNIDFDMMHVVEHDLFYFDSLDALFSHVPHNALALTGVTPLKNIEKKWYWTRSPQNKEWKMLMDYFIREYGYKDLPIATLGPGTSLPRSFLEAIKNIKIPDLSNDETRLPLLAQINNFPIYDTGFFRKWFSDKEYRFFNANRFVINLKTIEKQLQLKNGRRAFHPCNQDYSSEKLMELHQLTNKKRQGWFAKVIWGAK